MELLLLIIYSVIVWLIFFKFKILPWNITSQVIVVTIPIIMLTVLILFMNICAPSSSDVRAQNYVIPIGPRGGVVEVVGARLHRRAARRRRRGTGAAPRRLGCLPKARSSTRDGACAG